MTREQDIFKKGSTTYYFSSKFFPKKVREDIFKLYSFVRVADNYVDEKPYNHKALIDLEDLYKKNVHSADFDFNISSAEDINLMVIKNILYLRKKYNFKDEWIFAFFHSMKQDISPQPYETLNDSLHYVYGSADVIGLMMSKILSLPDKALPFAEAQGRAMQWINFIRDIKEDNALGRCYFPQEDLAKFELKDLRYKTVIKRPEQFKAFMQLQLSRYEEWQNIASKGYQYIPKRLRVPLITANNMYAWTASVISKDPLIVFEVKIKPSKTKVLSRAFKNLALIR